MGALSPSPSRSELIDLRELGGRELDPLLLEETVEWQTELDWDFGRSADLVRQFADMRALTGYALMDRGEVAGYGYSVVESYKGLIGDLYVRPAWRSGQAEAGLFCAILDELIVTPDVRRIESQLLLVEQSVGETLWRERRIDVHERILMSLDTSLRHLPPAGTAANRFQVESWKDYHQESAASVISLSYGDHIDSAINDQYRTLAGARRFIYNIVQFPGCGVFFKPGSFVAFDLATGWLAGIVLVSFVAESVGHITQLCVTPSFKRRGLGYELLRRAVATLQDHGARRISLTVTGANSEARQLYQRCGFREVRRFSAYAWGG